MRSYVLWTTKNCNLKCKYCYEKIDSMKDIFNESNFSFIRKLIANTSGEIFVRFLGGEPLLRFDIIKKYIKIFEEENVNAKYAITTNLTFLSNEMIQYLVKYFNGNITVSIDGTQNSHDLNRRDKYNVGTYSKVRKNIKKLKDQGLLLIANKTLTPNQLPSLKEDVFHLIDLSFDTIVINIDRINSEWYKEDFNEFAEQLIEIYLKLPPDDRDKIINLKKNLVFRKRASCLIDEKSFHLDSTGEIYPCSLAVGNREFQIGSSKLGLNREKIKMLNKINSLNIKTCNGCTMYQCCEGTRCKIVNKITTGNYIKPTPIHCYENRARLKLLKYL